MDTFPRSGECLSGVYPRCTPFTRPAQRSRCVIHAGASWVQSSRRNPPCGMRVNDTPASVESLTHHLPRPTKRLLASRGSASALLIPPLPLATIPAQTASKGSQRTESKGRDGKGRAAYPQRVAAGSARRMGNGNGCFKRSCHPIQPVLTAGLVSDHDGNAYTAPRAYRGPWPAGVHPAPPSPFRIRKRGAAARLGSVSSTPPGRIPRRRRGFSLA